MLKKDNQIKITIIVYKKILYANVNDQYLYKIKDFDTLF